MTKVYCLVDERFVNPLFEVFDGGDFILSSWRDVEESQSEMRIFVPEDQNEEAAIESLKDALEIVGVKAEIKRASIQDEDWKFAYRKHFKTEPIGKRLLVVPTWEVGRVRNEELGTRSEVVLDPGMAFGTGKHETTRACLEFIDELVDSQPSTISGQSCSFLDMGSGSGILSIAARKLGFSPVYGFDVDQEAVDASQENATLNGVDVRYYKFALGRAKTIETPRVVPPCRLVVANILGPLLIRFADEIKDYVLDKLVISGILSELYPEVLSAYAKFGFKEIARKTYGEWTTGLLEK